MEAQGFVYTNRGPQYKQNIISAYARDWRLDNSHYRLLLIQLYICRDNKKTALTRNLLHDRT